VNLDCRPANKIRLPGRSFRRRKIGSRIRVQQLGKARIFRQIVEIGIIARLEAQAGIQAKRLIQVLERIFHVAGKTIERGQP
jgi:hypothetical protein